MSRYVTLVRDSNNGPCTDWQDVADEVFDMLSLLAKDARELGVVPDWGTVEISRDFSTVEEITYVDSRLIVGRSALAISVRAEKEEDEND